MEPAVGRDSHRWARVEAPGAGCHSSRLKAIRAPAGTGIPDFATPEAPPAFVPPEGSPVAPPGAPCSAARLLGTEVVVGTWLLRRSTHEVADCVKRAKGFAGLKVQVWCINKMHSFGQ